MQSVGRTIVIVDMLHVEPNKTNWLFCRYTLSLENDLVISIMHKLLNKQNILDNNFAKEYMYVYLHRSIDVGRRECSRVFASMGREIALLSYKWSYK